MSALLKPLSYRREMFFERDLFYMANSFAASFFVESRSWGKAEFHKK